MLPQAADMSTRTHVHTAAVAQTGHMASLAPTPLPGPRRRPWHRARVATGIDLALAVLLVVAELTVFAAHVFALGMEQWAEGQAAHTPTNGTDWAAFLLVAALAVAVVASPSGLPWVALSQFLVAGLLAVLMAMGQHVGGGTYPPAPPPTPYSSHTPCYSGSGRCD